MVIKVLKLFYQSNTLLIEKDIPLIITKIIAPPFFGFVDAGETVKIETLAHQNIASGF